VLWKSKPACGNAEIGVFEKACARRNPLNLSQLHAAAETNGKGLIEARKPSRYEPFQPFRERRPELAFLMLEEFHLLQPLFRNSLALVRPAEVLALLRDHFVTTRNSLDHAGLPIPRSLHEMKSALSG
jgi:hypothetical protein